jgi:hypothetical protein
MHPLPPSIYIPLALITLAGMVSMVAIAFWQRQRHSLMPHRL